MDLKLNVFAPKFLVAWWIFGGYWLPIDPRIHYYEGHLVEVFASVFSVRGGRAVGQNFECRAIQNGTQLAHNVMHAACNGAV